MRKSSSQLESAKDPGTHNAGLRLDTSEQLPSGSLHKSRGSSSSVVIEQAFQKYNEALVRYLSVRLCSIQDAEEVAQEAYVRMLKLDDPDTISHLQAYLFKIASNIAIDRMRRKGRRPLHLSLDGLKVDIPAPASHVDRIVNAQQQLLQIREIVTELPPKCRKAFLLYKFKGRSYCEIAEAMHLTESTIRKYVLRAIVYCRSRMDEERKDG